jgi:hypothetical protein
MPDLGQKDSNAIRYEDQEVRRSNTELTDEGPQGDPMAGWGNNPVQVFRTLRDLHWEFLRLRTGFELPSSCAKVP